MKVKTPIQYSITSADLTKGNSTLLPQFAKAKHEIISGEISSKQVNEGSYDRKASEQSSHY